uniref:SPOC domain-containing protein n=1 Tax=Macrostomum lignano TaxID=282301 RepID=A0A1I8FME4_9PLAT
QRRADAALPDADRRPSMVRASREPDTSTVVGLQTGRFVRIDTDETSSPHRRHSLASCSSRSAAQGLTQTSRSGCQPDSNWTAAPLPNNRRWCLHIVAVAAAPGPDLLAGLFRRYAGRLRARRDAAACTRSQQLCRLSLGLVRAADCVGVVSSQPPSPASRTSRPPLPPLLELDKAKKVAEKAAASDSGDPNSKLASQTDPESAAYLDLCGARQSAGRFPADSRQLSAIRRSRVTPPSRHGRLSVPADSLRPAAWPRPARLCGPVQRRMAFIVACLASVACGHHTLLMPAGALSLEPSASGAAGFLQMLAQRFCAKSTAWPTSGPSSCWARTGPAGGAAREVRPPAGAAGPQPDSPALLIRLPRQTPCLTLPATDVERRLGSDLRRRQGAGVRTGWSR